MAAYNPISGVAVPKIPPGTFETISPPIIEGARAAIFAADEPTISPVAVLIEPSAAVLKFNICFLIWLEVNVRSAIP